MNDGLAHGRYFFMDVAKDGIALYQADNIALHTPKPKTPDQAFVMAREYFDEWYPNSIKVRERALPHRQGIHQTGGIRFTPDD